MKKFTKKTDGRKIRVCRKDSAIQAIGKLSKGTDTFILTYGQFSLIDAIMAIIRQTGPAHVAISTWTASHAHLDESAEMMAAAKFLSFRMIVDVSFYSRQAGYYKQMLDLFGGEAIREITTHAKFLLIRNDEWDIVVRTSMNLNGNPRLENLEISEGRKFAEFFQEIVDGIFDEVEPGENHADPIELEKIPETNQFNLVEANHIPINEMKEASFHHEIKH